MRIETVDGFLALQVNPYRWRLSGSFLAHLYKATTQQHHRALAATIMRLVPPASVVFDVGAHAGQYTKLFANAAAEGRVYAVEPGSYARSIRVAARPRQCRGFANGARLGFRARHIDHAG